MYNAKSTDDWVGRVDSTSNYDSFRLHQIVQQVDISHLKEERANIAFIGFQCDEGVRRNNGRPGAAYAPNELRSAMASIPLKQKERPKIVDVGNVQCEGTYMEEAQEELGKIISETLRSQTKAIVLGGGHETVYGHYLGVREAYGEDAIIGIVNIDAHFDLRDYTKERSSGTMFKQILDEDANARYFVCGIQEYGNTTELFERANDLGVTYLSESTMTEADVVTEFDTFAGQCDVLLLTLCMDVIEAAHAPGVSAPSPFGLHPKEVRHILQIVTNNEKTTSFNISEVNPLLDESGQTVKLGAYLTNEVLVGMLSWPFAK